MREPPGAARPEEAGAIARAPQHRRAAGPFALCTYLLKDFFWIFFRTFGVYYVYTTCTEWYYCILRYQLWKNVFKVLRNCISFAFLKVSMEPDRRWISIT